MRSKEVCQLDNGYFAGLALAYESPREPGVFLMPAGCVEAMPPELLEGEVARWDGGWVIEPVQATEPEPEPTPEELTEKARAADLATLAELDWRTIRPLRAIAAGTATQADRDRLADLEAQADAIRARLAE